MRSESTYQAARMVSEQIRNHFEHQLEIAGQRGEQDLPVAPPLPAIEAMLDVAFWASLRREEGYSPRISLAFISPEAAEDPLVLAQHLPLRPATLVKISPGVERPGIYLGVWYHHDELYVWGTVKKVPGLCFVLDVSEPGLLVVKHRQANGFGKFTNVAVFNGDQVRVVDNHFAERVQKSQILESFFRDTPSEYWQHSFSLWTQLAVSMRAHKHGGILLIVPSQSESWKQSIIHPLKYPIVSGTSYLQQLIVQNSSDEASPAMQAQLRHELESLAGLTAIDGATVITDRYELLTFGAKIIRREGGETVQHIVMHEPVLGNEPLLANPAQSGGTRHLAAAQFVQDQRDALAMVASQDGYFTVFACLPGEKEVQAYRIDTLLL
jgi:DNA integrity scanning protein DisA with diadenylate cyclase activity